MAPRRGGGGGGSWGSSNVCEGAFSNIFGAPSNLPIFVAYVLFSIVSLAIIGAWISTRKKVPGSQKLLGWVFGTALVFWCLWLLLMMVHVLVVECGGQREEIWSLTITFRILNYIFVYLLLVIVVLQIPSLLQQQLANARLSKMTRMVSWVVLGIMGALTLSLIVISSVLRSWYMDYTLINPDYATLAIDELRLSVAYWVLYLLIVLVYGAQAIVKARQAKIRMAGEKSLAPLLMLLTFSMTVWIVVYELVTYISAVANEMLPQNFYAGSGYTSFFFQSVMFITIILIAKRAALRPALGDYNTAQPVLQPAPGYGQPPQQVYAHQAPEVVPPGPYGYGHQNQQAYGAPGTRM